MADCDFWKIKYFSSQYSYFLGGSGSVLISVNTKAATLFRFSKLKNLCSLILTTSTEGQTYLLLTSLMCLALIFARGLKIWKKHSYIECTSWWYWKTGSSFFVFRDWQPPQRVKYFPFWPSSTLICLAPVLARGLMIRIDQYTYWMRYNINWKTATWYFACIKLTSSRAVSYTRLHRIKNNQAISIDWKTGYGGLELEQGGNDHDVMVAMVVMVVMMWGWRYCRWWWLWQWWCWWWWPVT